MPSDSPVAVGVMLRHRFLQRGQRSGQVAVPGPDEASPRQGIAENGIAGSRVLPGVLGPLLRQWEVAGPERTVCRCGDDQSAQLGRARADLGQAGFGPAADGAGRCDGKEGQGGDDPEGQRARLAAAGQGPADSGPQIIQLGPDPRLALQLRPGWAVRVRPVRRTPRSARRAGAVAGLASVIQR
jgi:hypothetical protein